MEEALEKVAGAVGSQWAKLYVCLKLEYRGRYKIQSQHADVKPKTKQCYQCAMDALAMWRAGLKEGSEEEGLRVLLTALLQLKNMETLTEQLAVANGERKA